MWRRTGRWLSRNGTAFGPDEIVLLAIRHVHLEEDAVVRLEEEIRGRWQSGSKVGGER